MNEPKFAPMPGTKGIEIAREEGYVYLRFPIAKNYGQSKSGNSYIVATTSGNKSIPGTQTMLGLNAYRATPSE